MKRLNFLMLLACVMFAFSCNDDDVSPNPDNILSYDGENSSAPLVEAGQHEFAARFLASQTSFFEGQELTHVDFFMGPVFPAKCEVKVYGANNSVSPGSLLYSKDVTNDLIGQDWNSHQLSTPITVPSGDLWIAIAVEHTTNQQSVGCDLGPANPNGDWLFKSTDGGWERYLDRTTESVNWNIKGIIGGK